MNTQSIVFVTNQDDWEGLYVDGLLVAEDHKIPRQQLVKHLHGKEGPVAEYFINPEFMDGLGRLPENLSDIPGDEILDKSVMD